MAPGSSLSVLKQKLRVLAVNPPACGRRNCVAQELLDVWGISFHDLNRNREVLVFLLAKVARNEAQSYRRSPLIRCSIGAAAVECRSQIDQAGIPSHAGLDALLRSWSPL